MACQVPEAANTSLALSLARSFLDDKNKANSKYAYVKPTIKEESLMVDSPIWLQADLPTSLQKTRVKGARNKTAQKESINLEQALTSLEECASFSVEDISCILHKCIRERNQDCALRLYTRLQNSGHEVHPALGNHLLLLLVEVGSMSEAQCLFDKLTNRDQSSWNSLITGYVTCGKLHHALNIYQKMQLDDSVHPNISNFLALLKACAKLKDLDRGFQLHAHVARNGLLDKHASVGSTLVSMYAKCGMLAKAQEVFDNSLFRDVVLWTALISGYTDQGCGEEALNCFDSMLLEGISPNAVTFICCLKACGSVGAIDKGEAIHFEIARNGSLERDVVVGTALLDMYVKCGSLAKAQQIFDKLSSRNIVSWNALITGYTQHGHSEDALRCFDCMQSAGISPNVVTFVSILKACAITGDIEKGQEIHGQIARKGLSERDPIIGTALINMYAKCGLVSKAQEVFDKLLCRDVVSWTALITGYVEAGCGAQALHCYEQMQLRGVSPDALTFVCGLKACGSERALFKGEQIHAEIDRRGPLAREAHVGTALIEMYAKCGALSRAQKVFNKLYIRDVVSWNALIGGYAQQNRDEEVLSCLERMQLEGVSPDDVSFVLSLKACGMVGRIAKGQEIHAEITKRGSSERDLILGCALVDMYGKCGLLGEAQKVFDKLLDRNVVSWTALIAGYVQHGHGYEALNCFELMRLEGIPPNAVTYVHMLKACASIGALDKGRAIHAEISKEGSMEKGLVIGTALVDMYAKCGLLTEAQQAFGKILDRDVILWNALIAGYANDGQCSEALRCFEQMKSEGISPDDATFICALKACASIGALEKGEEIHAEMSRKGLVGSNILVGTALVDMYAKCGSLAKARELFDNLPAQDLVLWNAIVAGFAEQGHGEDALKLFTKMQVEGISPDANTYVSSLIACASIGSIEKGQEIHAEIAKRGSLKIDLVVGTALVDMYAKCGFVTKAQEVFDQLPAPDIVLWSALIAGYAQIGDAESVFYMIDKMLGGGVKPNFATCVSVLNACSHTGLVDKGEMYLKEMSNDYGVFLMLEHYTCVVDLLSRAGQLHKAIRMVNLIPLHIDHVLWHTVLGACKKWSNLELGRHIFNHVVQVSGNESSAYILMSNIYLDADRQEDGNKAEVNEL